MKPIVPPRIIAIPLKISGVEIVNNQATYIQKKAKTVISKLNIIERAILIHCVWLGNLVSSFDY